MRSTPDYAALGKAVWFYYRKRALAIIAAKVKYGELPRLLTTPTACVHCGGRALIYEHRDYADPETVQPSCDPCNQRLGHAALDPEVVINHLRYSYQFPYRDGAKGGRPKEKAT